MKENEVNIAVDGFDFTVFLIKFDVRDRLIVSLTAPTEDIQKNFEKIAKKAEFDEYVELCIGNFKKNVKITGYGSSGRRGSIGENYKGTVKCRFVFDITEDDRKYLIENYYPDLIKVDMKELKEITITIDGTPIDIFFLNYRDGLGVHFNATTEEIQKKFVQVLEMSNLHKEVELCIGDFQKNVRVIGGGASGKNVSGSGAELNCSNAQCCIEFNASEEESNDLINKYYLGTTFPIEAYLEKYDEI